ncbi:retrovirus-related pol polyprotein from transposon TNT 1-94 [Tanacetum coccineum]
MNVEALQTKYPIIDWEVYTKDSRKYWKIIRVGDHTEVYQFFKDMLKNFDRDDLVKLWDLVRERFSSTEPTDDKERALWVELKRLFKPDTDDLLELQRYMHDPLTWRELNTAKDLRLPEEDNDCMKIKTCEEIPKNVNEALTDDSWIVAMQEELNQFIANDVWELVPQPRNMTIIGTKWVFRNKLDENGIVSRNKARLVAQGYNQQEGIDYDETYAPVARLESIRILLAYACALDFKLFQMDVKSAFLNGFINEEVYVAQPPGFIDFEKPNHVYKLKKALYGLKQAPKAWHYALMVCYPKGIGIETVVYADSDHAGDYVDLKEHYRKEAMSTSTRMKQALIDNDVELGRRPRSLRSRLVSDSTMRDVEWEPIEEERLEEPKEGWMLGESKKRSIRISSRMLIVGLVPQSRVTLVKARSNPSEAQHKFISSVISTRRGRRRMIELVVKYKAEKVCHEEMVKMPLVDLKDGFFRMCIDYRELSKIELYSDCHQMRVHEDEIPKTAFKMHYGRYEFTAMPFWVDQCTSDFHGRNESDEFGAAEEREVSCKAQQGQSGVKRKLFGSYRNNMGNEPILALPEGSDNFVMMRGARVRMLA